jgi:hypothetical protein
VEGGQCSFQCTDLCPVAVREGELADVDGGRGRDSALGVISAGVDGEAAIYVRGRRRPC